MLGQSMRKVGVIQDNADLWRTAAWFQVQAAATVESVAFYLWATVPSCVMFQSPMHSPSAPFEKRRRTTPLLQEQANECPLVFRWCGVYEKLPVSLFFGIFSSRLEDG